MAAPVAFKQQCPSCEAMVPVKDRSLIGRKIDCPKCKYRFVVEEPADESDGEEEKDKKEKPKAGKKAAPKSSSGKKKPTGKTRPDDEDSPKKKKKAAGNSTLMLGVGLGAVALLLLVIGGIFLVPMMLGGGGSGSPSSPGPSAAAPAAAPDAPPEGGTAPPPPAPAGPALVDITNLLPNDAQVVVSVNFAKVMGSGVKRVAFETPGGFRRENFERALGFPVEDLERVVVAGTSSGADETSFCVLRTTKPVSKDNVTRALGLQPDPKSPIEGCYFSTVTASLDSVPQAVAGGSTGGKPGPVSFYMMDEHTLVLASPSALQTFLKSKGKPKFLTQPPAPPPAEGTDPTAPGAAPAEGAQPAPMPAPEGAAPAGTPGAPGEGGAPPPVLVGKTSYMTVTPALKSVLDKVEESRQPVIFSMAVDLKAAANAIKNLDPKALGSNVPAGLVVPALNDFPAAAVALRSFSPSRLAAVAGLECKDGAAALKLEESIKPLLPLVRKQVGEFFKVKIQEEMPPVDPNDPNAPAQPGTVPGGEGAAGTTPPAAGQPPPEEDDKAPSKLKLTVNDRTLVFLADLGIETEMYNTLVRGAGQGVLQAKARGEMKNARPRYHDLGWALKTYTTKTNQFPRGTYPREPGPERAGLAWPPDHRVSWMVELLPYLGEGEFKALFERIQSEILQQKGWREGEIMSMGSLLIPHFLAHDSKEPSWMVNYHGVAAPLGATHYVGIAGIGLDAASYGAEDAAVAKKRGIFGYDRVTRVEDVTDGLDRTIAMIQAPPHYKTPWIAGGGSTVRGVTETDSVRSFVCTEYKNKRGTYAIMADGKVRFIPETITDKDFLALCTIAGGEEIIDVEAIAPEVPGPKRRPTELRTTVATPAVPAPATTPPSNPAPAAPPPAAAPPASPSPMPTEPKQP